MLSYEKEQSVEDGHPPTLAHGYLLILNFLLMAQDEKKELDLNKIAQIAQSKGLSPQEYIKQVRKKVQEQPRVVIIPSIDGTIKQLQED